MIDKMKTVKLGLVLTAVLIITAVGAAEDPPELPHVVSGEVSVDGGPFDSTYSGPVYAVSDGEVYGDVSADDGQYSDMPVTGPQDGEFTIWVGQVETDLSSNYKSGEVETLDSVDLQVEDLDAEVEADQTDIEPGTTVEFDASGSSGSTGIDSIEWDFDNRESEECELDNVFGELECESVEHTFEEEGTYEVDLTVYDESGNSDTEEIEISVETPQETPSEETPANTGGGAFSADVGFTVETDGLTASFEDDSNTYNREAVSYEWEFGDNSDAEGETVEHTYSDGGEYEVTLTVEDDEGSTHSDTNTVTVEESEEDSTENNQQDEDDGSEIDDDESSEENSQQDSTTSSDDQNNDQQNQGGILGQATGPTGQFVADNGGSTAVIGLLLILAGAAYWKKEEITQLAAGLRAQYF